MALKKVIAAVEAIRVKTLVTYIYADPGIGKTSLAYTAKNPILFDFDSGAHRSGSLRRGATVPVEHWLDVANIEASDVTEYDSIIIDTAGRALDMIKSHLAENRENRQKDGSLKLKAQGIANELFKNWITRIRGYNKDVIIIAHAIEDKKGDDIIFRPDVGGKNKNELYRQADLMGCLTNVSGDKGRRVRLLSFSPSTDYHAKNSGGLGDVELPDLSKSPSFLADLIQQSKDHINSLTDAQVKELQHLDDLQNWKNDCANCENANDLNELIGKIDKEHRFFTEMRQSFGEAAKSLSVVFDKDTGRYNDKDAPSKTAAPVTDPIAESNPQPVEQPTVDRPKIDVIPLLRAITNAINLEALKAAVDAIPKDGLSEKDCDTLNRAYKKRKTELQPLSQDRVDSIVTILEMATTKDQLDQTWKKEIDAFVGVITEPQLEHFSHIYDSVLSEIQNEQAA